ncbi:MAG: Clp protease N-terminal domain-containing protein, partial [Fimbriimonas sp.]
MRFDKLTLKAQDVFQSSQAVAERFQHQLIEPEHLMLALLDQDGGITKPILQKLSVDVKKLKIETEKAIERFAKVSGTAYGESISNKLQVVFQSAFSLASELKDEYVSTEHFLLALSEDQGVIGKQLRGAGANKELLL